MSLYRNHLPQLSGELFLTDGGMETTLVFHQNIELPLFAAFDLLSIESGRKRLQDYYESYCQYSASQNIGFILESPTWRASPDWGSQLGYSAPELLAINQQSVEMLVNIREKCETAEAKVVISGCIGPRGDGYQVDKMMTVEQAQQYHRWQVNIFADTAADLITAMTLNYVDEAIGIALAAKEANMPVVISFTTETDGKLPNGTSLADAIMAVDKATNKGPVYYMINCAHPDHFADALDPSAEWSQRIRSIRANSSRMSHAELDQSETLDRGNPKELGQLYHQLRQRFPQLSVLGGCCGTDLSHIQSIQQHCCAH